MLCAACFKGRGVEGEVGRTAPPPTQASHAAIGLPVPGEWVGGGGYLIYPWVERCCLVPQTVSLFKTKIVQFFDTLFKVAP